MPTTIKYKNSIIAELRAGEIGAVSCADKEMEEDIIVVAPNIVLQEITITENGEYTPSGDGYSKVTVEVERPQLVAPTLSIVGDILTITDTNNGTFATSYDLYIDGSLSGNYTSTTIDLTTLGLAEGAFAVTAVAKGTNFIDSDVSASIWYIKGEYYLTFSSPSSFTLNIADNAKYWDGTLEYSTDTSTWNEWDGTTTLSADNGVLYMRGTGNTYITGSEASLASACWALTGSEISCVGNIENLLDYATVANGEHPTMANYCYSYMFRNCRSLVTAPELPAITLTSRCYYNMFNYCTNLTTAPELPATTLAESCYYGMFEDCASLTAAPELPATTLTYGCYDSMFRYCTGLTTVPELPATTLANYCYYDMFFKCTSLVTAPELPATTLANYCYHRMFYGCTSLTTVPKLPATTLASKCYYRMFNGCTSLKLSAEQTDEYTIAYRIPTSGEGTILEDATDVLTYMFIDTSGTFTGTPEINTTYYLHKSNSVV